MVGVEALSRLGRVAAFDFDGTVARRDTFVPFLVAVHGRAKVAAAVASAVTGERSREAAKSIVLRRLLGGMREEDATRSGERYAEMLLSSPDALNTVVVDAVRSYVMGGGTAVLVSASLDLYLKPLAPRLGFHAALCSTMEVEDGVLTGRLAGANCSGQEKVERLVAWAGGMPENLVAYGNSRGDLAMLNAAASGFWVGRDGRVSRYSPRRRAMSDISRRFGSSASRSSRHS